jgi:hypothetical protein
MKHTQDEIDEFVTEFVPRPEEDIVDILRGRIQVAVQDQIHFMIQAGKFANPNEIKELILRDVEMEIDSFNKDNEYFK